MPGILASQLKKGILIKRKTERMENTLILNPEYIEHEPIIIIDENDLNKLDLTIAIPVKNEELNLPKCLAAIGEDLARNVVVIDSGSTDKTRQIAEDFGAEVIDFDWDGKFPKKRNWFLRNYRFKTNWVLFLDADEYFTPEFKADLLAAINRDDKVGYWLSYSVYFLGKKLKGGYPLRKLALFKVGSGEYEKIDENMWSQLDMEVHEHPIILGATGVIKSKIDHHDLRGTAIFKSAI